MCTIHFWCALRFFNSNSSKILTVLYSFSNNFPTFPNCVVTIHFRGVISFLIPIPPKFQQLCCTTFSHIFLKLFQVTTWQPFILVVSFVFLILIPSKFELCFTHCFFKTCANHTLHTQKNVCPLTHARTDGQTGLLYYYR